METSPFFKPKDEFTLLDLTAVVAFRTHSSIAFSLGRWSGSRHVFTHVGWLDVHHPCEGHIKTLMRVHIPTKYHVFEQMKSIIARVFEVLAIPSDETYQADFFHSDKTNEILNHTDRDGLSDGFYCG
jgi:hypothetical protein